MNVFNSWSETDAADAVTAAARFLIDNNITHYAYILSRLWLIERKSFSATPFPVHGNPETIKYNCWSKHGQFPLLRFFD